VAPRRELPGKSELVDALRADEAAGDFAPVTDLEDPVPWQDRRGEDQDDEGLLGRLRERLALRRTRR